MGGIGYVKCTLDIVIKFGLETPIKELSEEA